MTSWLFDGVGVLSLHMWWERQNIFLVESYAFKGFHCVLCSVLRTTWLSHWSEKSHWDIERRISICRYTLIYWCSYWHLKVHLLFGQKPRWPSVQNLSFAYVIIALMHWAANINSKLDTSVDKWKVKHLCWLIRLLSILQWDDFIWVFLAHKGGKNMLEFITRLESIRFWKSEKLKFLGAALSGCSHRT